MEASESISELFLPLGRSSPQASGGPRPLSDSSKAWDHVDLILPPKFLPVLVPSFLARV